MPALVWLGLAALGLWSGARIVEAVTDDPDVPNDPTPAWPLYLAAGAAGAAWWLARR